MNIGVHLFDMCQYLLGPESHVHVYKRTERRVQGQIIYPNAEVNFDLNTQSRKTWRIFSINGHSFDLTDNNLHIKAYEDILNGNGVKPMDMRRSIGLVEQINDTPTIERNVPSEDTREYDYSGLC